MQQQEAARGGKTTKFAEGGTAGNRRTRRQGETRTLHQHLFERELVHTAALHVRDAFSIEGQIREFTPVTLTSPFRSTTVRQSCRCWHRRRKPRSERSS